MVFNQHDVREAVIAGKPRNQRSRDKDQRSKQPKRFELNPYHLLLIMYGVIAVIGVAFNITH